MDKNEAYSKARDLVNLVESKRFVDTMSYLRDVLETAVNSESDVVVSKQTLDKLGNDISAKKAELDSLDADVKARSELAKSIKAKTDETIQNLQTALAAAQDNAKQSIEVMKQDHDRTEKEYNDRVAQMNAEYEINKTKLQNEFNILMKTLQDQRIEEEQKLNNAKKSYTEFISGLKGIQDGKE